MHETQAMGQVLPNRAVYRYSFFPRLENGMESYWKDSARFECLVLLVHRYDLSQCLQRFVIIIDKVEKVAAPSFSHHLLN